MNTNELKQVLDSYISTRNNGNLKAYVEILSETYYNKYQEENEKLPYYISKYTVGEFRKIFHLAYFLATVRLDLLIGEIKKKKESTSCVQRMPKNVTLRASSLLVV